jgi:hypothetical protein
MTDQARQAIEGLLDTEDVKDIAALVRSHTGDWDRLEFAVIKALSKKFAPAWAEMQRERDEFETRLANLKFDLDMIGAQLGITNRDEIEGAVLHVVKRAEQAEARAAQAEQELELCKGNYDRKVDECREEYRIARAAEVERDALLKLKVHCPDCGGDYAATGLEVGCKCQVVKERDALRRVIDKARTYLTDELAELRRDCERVDSYSTVLHARAELDRLLAAETGGSR